MVLFENSVFLNCPFDEEFEPILQIIAFTIIYFGLNVRIAPENTNNSSPRLARINQIISECKFGIHDISRCKAKKKGEFARMNMPFELGMDYSASIYGNDQHKTKQILVLGEKPYDFQKSLSDISGWDIKTHGGNVQRAAMAVRNWLVSQPEIEIKAGPSKIMSEYASFQEWYWKKKVAEGASEHEIKQYPTTEMLSEMVIWRQIPL